MVVVSVATQKKKKERKQGRPLLERQDEIKTLAVSGHLFLIFVMTVW